MAAATCTDRGLTHGSYPFDGFVWAVISSLKPLEAARRVGHNPSRKDKDDAKKGVFYAVHNKCYIVLNVKGMADPSAKGPFPKGTRALYCADGRHMIIEKS